MTAIDETATPVPALRGLGRSFSALLLGELANKVLRFGAMVVLARSLTPADFGLFNVGIAAGGILVVLATLGLPEVAGRAVAVAPERARSLAGSVALVRVLTTLAMGGLGLLAMLVVWPERLGFGVAVVVMAAVMGATADWVGRALERMRLVGSGAAAGGLMALVGAVVVGVASGSATAALVAFVVAEAVADLVYWLAVRGRRGTAAVGSGLRDLLAKSWPVALSSIAIYSYYANLDTIILAASRSEAEAGFYSGAYRIYLAANIVGIFAAYATFPQLSRLSDVRERGALVRHLRPTLELLVAYGVAVVGFSLVAGRQLLELSFGEAFGTADDTFVLLCLSTTWYCVGYPLGYNLVAAERNRRFLAGALSGAVTALVLDLVLIPPYGMTAAAAATTVSVIVATTIWVGPREMVSPAARPVFAILALVTIAAVGGLMADGVAVGAGLLLMVAALGFASHRFLGNRA